jgi:hypothetical protein
VYWDLLRDLATAVPRSKAAPPSARRRKVCFGSTAAGRVWSAWVRYRRVSPIPVRPVKVA